MCTAPLGGKSVNTLLLVSNFFNNCTKPHVLHMLHLIKLRNIQNLETIQKNTEIKSHMRFHMPMQTTMSNQYNWAGYTLMLYIKQIILRVIKQMDLNERAEIKKKSSETTKDQYSQCGLFFSFIYLTNSKMCQSIKDSHKSQGNKQTKKKNHESHLKHHCLVLIGITNKECV